jgi:hypothetical protein
LTQTTAIGGDMLTVQGANTKEIAKLIVPPTKSTG